jgi:hypothetical protein
MKRALVELQDQDGIHAVCPLARPPLAVLPVDRAYSASRAT